MPKSKGNGRSDTTEPLLMLDRTFDDYSTKEEKTKKGTQGRMEFRGRKCRQLNTACREISDDTLQYQQ